MKPGRLVSQALRMLLGLTLALMGFEPTLRDWTRTAESSDFSRRY